MTLKYKAFLLALWLLSPQPVKAYEPTNAPDVKGNFVLVMHGTATGDLGYYFTLFRNGQSEPDEVHYRVQPFTIPGFKSYQACVGAGKELQARMNTNGYTMDFNCVGVK